MDDKENRSKTKETFEKQVRTNKKHENYKKIQKIQRTPKKTNEENTDKQRATHGNNPLPH